MKSVNVAELKNRLSHYLGFVREGEEVLVRDRNRPVAKIVPLSIDDVDREESDLAAAGLLRLPERPLPRSFWRMPAPRLARARAVAAVTADREED